MEALDGLDAAFLALESETIRLHVATVMVLDPPEGRRSLFSPETRFDQIRNLVAARLHLAPPLRQRALAIPFGLDRPVWADDPGFDLDAHLRRAALPQPGSVEQLEALVADLLSQPLPTDRPLWDMVVVEGLSQGRTAVVVRLHHALLDGVSGAALLATFLDLGPRGRAVFPPACPWAPGPLPTAGDLIRHGLRRLGAQPASLLGTAQRLVEAALELQGRQQQETEESRVPSPLPFAAPRTSLNGPVGSRRRFATARVTLADVLDVRRAFGTKANDVVLAAVSGALRNQLLARHEDVPETMVAMVPISIRTEAEGSRFGNLLSGTLVPLPTGEADPVRRLVAVSRAAVNAKEQAEAVGEDLLMQVADSTPPAFTSRLARWASAPLVQQRLPPLANVTVSNIAGPQESLWCAGSRIDALYPAGPVAEGVGLNVTVLSYRGILHLGVVACRRLAPDLDSFAARLVSALEELTALAGVRRSAAG